MVVVSLIGWLPAADLRRTTSESTIAQADKFTTLMLKGNNEPYQSRLGIL
jgi:hypothetical protein